MKTTYTLTDSEIKLAIIHWVAEQQCVDADHLGPVQLTSTSGRDQMDRQLSSSVITATVDLKI